MPNPTAAMLIIGDEILSGRTRDINGHVLAGHLTRIGMDLRQIRVVGDHAPTIIAALNSLREEHDQVFTSGGIGPTHDDITADCIAAAFGVPIDVRDDARALLAAHYPNGESDLTPARLRMARIPEGASLIENPISKAPGFSIGNVHVLAGVPNIFAAMLEAVLPTLTGGQPLLSVSVRIDRPESALATPLGQIAARHPDVAIGSYPYVRDGRFGADLVARSTDPARLEAVRAELEALASI